ncbi:RND transporter [Cellvibrio zantedeschiae]|uniref:RND transporter n=1 Tax=Cellvibrio zantedeschiae TaxID=1237077 RepID=A0ABQ3BAC5_9GAMM|nr:efflux RND transporter periplasmic adaptor subunit [Cellvibrio zantedeschiae]GGY80851.1 RND transporter [Cellvibrio zantedeschiae]
MKKPIIIGVILCLIIGVPVIKKLTSGDSLKKVEVEALTNRAIKASIIASGNLNHEEKVQLSTEVIGKVKSIFVKEGDKVVKGQLLLQIDDEAYISATEQNQAAVRMQRIAIERLQSHYQNLLAQWQRKKVLFDKKLIDPQTFDAISLELASADFQVKSGREQLIQAEAQLAQAKNNLAKTRAYSPIDGVVTSLTIKVGETAIAGTMNFAASSLMTIANPASLHAEVNVDEADITNVAVGQRAEVVAIAHSDQPINGTVAFIAETAKVATGRSGLSFAVKIRFEDSKNIKLWPGMSARAEIFTSGETSKLAVPIQAIVSQHDDAKKSDDRKTEADNDKAVKATNNYIFVADNNKARRVAVTLGLSDDEYQEITSIKKDDVKVGDKIILGPDRILRYLKDGEKITPEDKKTSDKKDTATKSASSKSNGGK